MSPRLPALSAHSSDVRAYISRTLVSKLGIAPDIADETAELWENGRGAELYDVPARAFESLFGEQTGWSLFRIVHEDKLQDWKKSSVGMLSSCRILPWLETRLATANSCFFVLFSAIIVTVFLVLRIFVQYTPQVPITKGFKKGTLSLFQALSALGLMMIIYGFQTPSFEGDSIAIAGIIITFPAMFAVYLCFLPEMERGEENYSKVSLHR